MQVVATRIFILVLIAPSPAGSRDQDRKCHQRGPRHWWRCDTGGAATQGDPGRKNCPCAVTLILKMSAIFKISAHQHAKRAVVRTPKFAETLEIGCRDFCRDFKNCLQRLCRDFKDYLQRLCRDLCRDFEIFGGASAETFAGICAAESRELWRRPNSS